MQVLNCHQLLGPGTGILGITSLTLTNFDTQPQQVFLFVPIFSGARLRQRRQQHHRRHHAADDGLRAAAATLHLTYPTPLVINPYAGNTCIAAEVTTLLHGGSVTIDVNGVVN